MILTILHQMMRDARSVSLITIPQVDTVSNGTNYYDVAVLEAREMARITGHSIKHRGAGGTGKDGDGQHLGKAGGKSTLSDGGVPTYTRGKSRKDYLCKRRRVLFYDAGEIRRSAVYKKVAVSVGRRRA